MRQRNKSLEGAKAVSAQRDERPTRRERPSSSLSRTFALLDLFTPQRMVWSAEAMIDHCGYSRPTGYRYIRELVETGLLVRFGDGFYSLGPRVVELDLLIRQADPLLSAGLPIIRDIVSRTGVDLNLIRRYDERIVTIHQESGGDRLLISFGRGRQLPLLRGAGSKVIVAHLPRGRLKRIYDSDPELAAQVGYGENWLEFRNTMSAIRRAGFAMSYGELDDGLAGVAAPIFGIDGVVIGSIVAALTQQRLALIQIDKLTDAIKTGAARISEEVAIISDPARHIDETQGAET
ncbi:IclR family transcriptional regulator [Methylocella sp. CPCC 101449]|uniref:IclR family transcriptional regulator n=1 Tax=Methylocella sp. CPCC 101449 TaxID=2987531 RepID=UPI00288DA8F9|nr:IclR family transcriptional regulator [Methylocella sp. CPCC 101449]MDT2023747.1 IclR family transcriptional regulator [Methylocella sp. CPCC 101449]